MPIIIFISISDQFVLALCLKPYSAQGA